MSPAPSAPAPSADKLYYAKGLVVWKSPVREKLEDGTRFTVGFPVCTVSDYVGEEGAATVAELLILGEASPAQSPSSLSVTLDRKLGGTGAAYDPPGPHRAYTYNDQPHNGPAYRLGCAVAAATHERSGDAIDAGLYLLKELQARGFGVFEIEPQAGTAIAPSRGGREVE